MKQWISAPGSRAALPFTLATLADRITRVIEAALDRIFGLTHQASSTRWQVLVVGFVVAWMASIVVTIPEFLIGAQPGGFLEALQTTVFVEPANEQEWLGAVLKTLFVVVFHPAVLKHLLAFIVPFWVMHRFTAIYLADIFEEFETTARQLIDKAAFGLGYETIRIQNGKVAEEHLNSTLVKIGGPGYVQVGFDSAVLFERPDGTPHVVRPTDKGIIDDFERIRRVVDLRDTIESIDLLPTRSRDGIIVGAKDIQFSYSIHRGESPKRTETPYPVSNEAIENLVYKDTRAVKPGVVSAYKPERELGPFKMGGPIMNEISGFIGKRRLDEFLAAVGEPEKDLLIAREQRINQVSQAFSDINGDLDDGQLLQIPEFASRNSLTEIFYNQEDFQRRMANKGFQLNWIGVGTWYTPAETISINHRDAWKISRENNMRGSPQALETLQTEARLQEWLRLMQALPIGKFYSEQEKADDEHLLDSLLKEYEELLQQAAELYMRGENGLDLCFSRLVEDGNRLFERFNLPFIPLYDDFLQAPTFWISQLPSVFSGEVQSWLSRAPELYKDLKPSLGAEDQEFLQQAKCLYQDLKNYNQIQNVINTISQVRRTPYHRVGT